MAQRIGLPSKLGAITALLHYTPMHALRIVVEGSGTADPSRSLNEALAERASMTRAPCMLRRCCCQSRGVVGTWRLQERARSGRIAGRSIRDGAVRNGGPGLRHPAERRGADQGTEEGQDWFGDGADA